MTNTTLKEKIEKEEATIVDLIGDVIALMEDFDDLEIEELVDLIIEEGRLIYKQNESLKKKSVRRGRRIYSMESKKIQLL